MSDPDTWLVGAGPMARAYAKVLQGQERAFKVIGRGAQSAKDFAEATGVEVMTGGVEARLAEGGAPRAAIVSTGVDVLYANTLALLDAGTGRILIEKPAALYRKDLAHLADLARQKGAQLFVAYNRRFFQSVIEAQRLIDEDGGLQSISYDFTEIAARVGRMERPEEIKHHWLIANSTHVIDLAFYLAGAPQDWHAFRSGGLDWHPSSAVFAGAGVTEKGVLFSYSSNWNGPGRWGVELVTAKRRIVLRPMEKLAFVDEPMGAMQEPSLDYSLDEDYKPGLFEQVRLFLDGTDRGLCTIDEQLKHMDAYQTIAGYQEDYER